MNDPIGSDAPSTPRSRRASRRWGRVVLSLALAAWAVACGGGEDGVAGPSSTAEKSAVSWRASAVAR